jgi:hypothetical protein
MAYDVSGMAAYSKSNGSVLIADLILGSQAFNQAGIRVEPGIKSTDVFADFSVGNTYLQTTNGDPGALSYSGGSTLKDISITVKEMAVKERYVKTTLDSKIAQMLMRAGSSPSNPLPYADVLVGLKQQEIGLLNDKLLWQGVTTSSDPNLNKFNGWITLATATGSTGVISGGSSAALVAGTAIASIEAIKNVAFATFPTWVNEGCFMFMSPAQFSIYYRALFGLASMIDSLALNTGKPVAEFYIPGTNVLVQSTNGLVGKNNILITRDNNLVIGTDLVSEDDSLTFEYLNNDLIWRLLAIYKLGAQIGRRAEVVVTK